MRAYALQQLQALGRGIESRTDANPMGEAHLRQAVTDIARYLQDPAANAPKFIAPG